ncbi:hypothetical protein ACS0TY_032783 [Phlomoides rotata]
MDFPQTIGQAMQCPMYAITKCLAYRKAKDNAGGGRKVAAFHLVINQLHEEIHLVRGFWSKISLFPHKALQG